MGHNGKDEIMVEASAMVEIKIKTLDSQTYTLRVDKCVPVPALKEQIATVTGVVTDQQRLICRGKVLKDDQLLSAYHVEDGHTLHLVVRQPIPPLSESSAADPALSAGDGQGSQRSRVVVGSFNIAEPADGMFSDLGQIVSAVLGSLGIANPEGGIEGLEAMGPLHERLSRSSTARDSSGGQSASPNAVDQTSTQQAAIPDSLTTLSEYLVHLRQEFAAHGSNANNLQTSGNSVENVQDTGSTTGESRIQRPSHLAEVMQSTRQLLIGQVAEYFSNISRQLVDHVNVTDPATRRLQQSNMVESGVLLENLGTYLLELGRATMMLRLGQTPDDAVVNAGPAVFISPTGRNPLPSSRSGASIGGLPAGTAAPSPFAGHSLASAPRNIEIRIRTGSWVPASAANQREESTTQQTPGQSVPSAPSNNNDAVPPSMRGPSDPHRSPVALVIPVVASYQQVSSDSSRQPQSAGTPGREGDSSASPGGGRGLSDLRNRIHQFLRPLSRREHAQAGSSESQAAANPSAQASAETNEAVPNAQMSGTDEGNFISSVLQQIMPFISQNLASSSSDESAGRGSRQASSREEEEGAERGDSSSRRREPPSGPESKRQRRE